MKTSGKNPFAGLPVTLVNELLGQSGRLAQKIYEPIAEIRNTRDALLGKLNENGIIRKDSAGEGAQAVSSCAVDGCWSIEKLLASGIVCSAAFAVEGLPPPSGEKHWDAAVQKTMLDTDRHLPETGALLRAVMHEMEIELTVSAPHTVVFLNGSYHTPFISIMETLQVALKSGESITRQAFVTRLKPTLKAFETMSNSTEDKTMWVGVPGDMSKSELAESLKLPGQYHDSILLSVLLSPGEYTTPVPAAQNALSRVKNLPIKDEGFSAVRDRLVSFMSRFYALYYRPFQWTPVFRLEVPDTVAHDASRLAVVLATLRYQCETAGISQPYPLYCAGKTVKNLGKAFSSLRTSAASHITHLDKENVGELFPLLMVTDSQMGDNNE